MPKGPIMELKGPGLYTIKTVMELFNKGLKFRNMNSRVTLFVGEYKLTEPSQPIDGSRSEAWRCWPMGLQAWALKPCGSINIFFLWGNCGSINSFFWGICSSINRGFGMLWSWDHRETCQPRVCWPSDFSIRYSKKWYAQYKKRQKKWKTKSWH